MTYCVGVLVHDGLVMISDTRTNAGIDNIASYRKLYLFEEPGERVLALASSGNLSVSQAVVSLLTVGGVAVALMVTDPELALVALAALVLGAGGTSRSVSSNAARASSGCPHSCFHCFGLVASSRIRPPSASTVVSTPPPRNVRTSVDAVSSSISPASAAA